MCTVFRSASAQPSASTESSSSLMSSSHVDPAPSSVCLDAVTDVHVAPTSQQTVQLPSDHVPSVPSEDAPSPLSQNSSTSSPPTKKARFQRPKRTFEVSEATPNKWTVIGAWKEDAMPTALDAVKELGYEGIEEKHIIECKPNQSKTKPSVPFLVFEIVDVTANEQFVEWVTSEEGVKSIQDANARRFGQEKRQYQFLALTADEPITPFLHFATICWTQLPNDKATNAPWSSTGSGKEVQDTVETCRLVSKDVYLETLKVQSSSFGPPFAVFDYYVEAMYL